MNHYYIIDGHLYSTEELKHYGVQGMKWGVRKDDDDIDQSIRDIHDNSINVGRLRRAGQKLIEKRDQRRHWINESRWESGDKNAEYYKDELEYDMERLSGRMKGYCDGLANSINNAYKTYNQKGHGLNDDTITLLDMYGDAFSSTRALMKAVGDYTVPSSEVNRLLDSACNVFDRIYDATDVFDD